MLTLLDKKKYMCAFFFTAFRRSCICPSKIVIHMVSIYVGLRYHEGLAKIQNVKTCKLCNLEKPLNAFYSYRNPQSDGVVKSYMSYCKCCDKRESPKQGRLFAEHLVPLGGARLDQRQHGFAISVRKMRRLSPTYPARALPPSSI